MKWFRLYSSVLHDPKVQKLPPALFKHWINILCLASETDDHGRLPDREAIAFALRMYPYQSDKILARLSHAGLLELDQDSKLCVHKWESRQSRSDNVTLRVRDYRERHNAVDSRDQGYTNSGNVTLHVTGQKRYGNVLDGEGDRERDRDTTKERLNTKYKNGGKDGSAPARARTTPSNQFLRELKDEEIIRQLPPHVVEQFAPEQIQEEAKKARAWYSSSDREHPMPLDTEHLKNWLLRIPAAQRQKPNETEVERYSRILASWDRLKNEKGLVDGQTWNVWNDRLHQAKWHQEEERYQQRYSTPAALSTEETDLVQQNGAHPPPTDG